MHSVSDITAIELQYVHAPSRPSLGEALELWRTRWKSGLHDRETALRTMFLVWYSCAEPQFLTGLQDKEGDQGIFQHALDSLGGSNCEDHEACLVVGFMAELFPWCLGNEQHWSRLGSELSRRAQHMGSTKEVGIMFNERGAYGEYFSHVLAAPKRDA